VRIFAKATARGTLPENDKSYLASGVAQRTGLPHPEAEKRVTEAFAEANRAVKEAADKARRASILTGFVTAASLMVSFGAAWWAALRGGNHRDNQVPARFAVPVQRRLS
jgi:DNA-binding MarR family transcriptional regulator